VISVDPITGARKILKYEFEGNYKDDKKEGYGVFKWPSNSIYEGNFSGDFRHGFGIMKWADGTVYEGSWEHGVQQGMGRMQLSDGTIKVGLFKQNILVEEHSSDYRPDILGILGNSDSSKQFTKLHETLLETEYDTLVKQHYARKLKQIKSNSHRPSSSVALSRVFRPQINVD